MKLWKGILGGLVKELGPALAQQGLDEVVKRIEGGQTSHPDISPGVFGEVTLNGPKPFDGKFRIMLNGADITGICVAADDKKDYADVRLFDMKRQPIWQVDANGNRLMMVQRLYGDVVFVEASAVEPAPEFREFTKEEAGKPGDAAAEGASK